MACHGPYLLARNTSKGITRTCHISTLKTDLRSSEFSCYQMARNDIGGCVMASGSPSLTTRAPRLMLSGGRCNHEPAYRLSGGPIRGRVVWRRCNGAVCRVEIWAGCAGGGKGMSEDLELNCKCGQSATFKGPNANKDAYNAGWRLHKLRRDDYVHMCPECFAKWLKRQERGRSRERD